MIELPAVDAELLAALPARQRSALLKLAQLAGVRVTEGSTASKPLNGIAVDPGAPCEHCATPVPPQPVRRGEPKRFCSGRCRWLAWLERQRGRA